MTRCCCRVASPLRASESREISVATRDGWWLAASLFRAPGDACRVVLIAPAIGASRHRYAPFAAHLARRGWTAVTFDYRGMGESRARDAGAPDPTLVAWGEEDLSAMIDWIERELAPARITAVAHSIGGHLLGLARNHERLAAALAVSAPRHHWWLFTGFYRYLLYAFFRFTVPLLVALLGRLPMRLARLDDLPGLVALDWAHAALHDDSTLAPRWRRLREGFRRFTTPLLALSFEDDRRIAPRRTVEELLRTFYRHVPRWHLHVDPAAYQVPALGHSGFFDGVAPPRWWDDVACWLASAPEWPSCASGAGSSLLAAALFLPRSTP
jgi:predicted alpha/beta hydrolase